MKSSRQFHNIFIPNQSSATSPISPRLQSPLKQSHYFDKTENLTRQKYPSPNLPIYSNQKIHQSNKSTVNSQIFHDEYSIKQYSVMQRSKSQLIPSLYVSPYKKELTEELNQSNCLASSNASQITFAKPSQFINNTQKQSFCNISSQKMPTQIVQNVNNDYGYNINGNNLNTSLRKDHSFNIKSPMKSSFLDNYNSTVKNSLIFNKNQVQRNNNFIETSMFQSQIITMRPLKTTVIFKNEPADFNFKPQLKRAMSNISIMSQKSRNNNSGTKVRFNYISPAKSETKKPRKLSFKKQDVKNPLNKLTKKKQSSKIKIDKSPQNNLNTEVVNQYFPQFKVKKNKMLRNVVSPIKRTSKYKKNEPLPIQENKNDDALVRAQQVRKQIELQLKLASTVKKPLQQTKQQTTFQDQMNHLNTFKIDKAQNLEDEGMKNHTFIAGLDGFSQISEIKIRQKEDSTEISNDTPKKNPLFQFRHDDTLKNKRQIHKEDNKISGYRITLTGQMIPLSAQNNEIFHNSEHQISGISKDSQVSIPSHDLNLSKKQQNNSSKTTDYEQEMVRKLKQELGLNYSYYKKGTNY